MNKQSIILTYFQKSHLLTTQNPSYGKTLTSLFTWLTENDEVHNDKTTQLLRLSGHVKASLVAKEDIIVAGTEEITYLLQQNTKLSGTFSKRDGAQVKRGEIIGEISGTIPELLSYERTIVNILQRMSGIASQTSRLINLISSHLSIHIAATRKTPWMQLDKKAVSVGGGLTHRLSLADGILVKDNHLCTIPHAIKKTLETILPRVHNQLIEIEVKEEKEAHIALTTYNLYNPPKSADTLFRRASHLALLFDNFTPAELTKTIKKLKDTFDLRTIILEASGGITEKNIKEWTQTGVDILSLGTLTHSSQAANISLEF